MITTQDVDRQRKNDNSPHLPTMTGTGTPTGVTMTTTIDCGTKIRSKIQQHFILYHFHIDLVVVVHSDIVCVAAYLTDVVVIVVVIVVVVVIVHIGISA